MVPDLTDHPFKDDYCSLLNMISHGQVIFARPDLHDHKTTVLELVQLCGSSTAAAAASVSHCHGPV